MDDHDGTGCTDCEGFGYHVLGDTNSPNARRERCDACLGTGSGDPEAIHARAAEDGDVCPVGHCHCPACRAAALDAGIPLSVVEGKTKLTDHFSEERIDLECGRIGPAESMAQARLLK